MALREMRFNTMKTFAGIFVTTEHKPNGHVGCLVMQDDQHITRRFYGHIGRVIDGILGIIQPGERIVVFYENPWDWIWERAR